MYTCILIYVYMQDIYVYMQDDYVYVHTYIDTHAYMYK